MAICPHISPEDPSFPGDASPQPFFGLRDSLRSLALWGIGVPHLAAWTAFVIAASKVTDLRNVDGAVKLMARAVPALAGVRIRVKGQELLTSGQACVYVVNHVNIFDMFAIYRAIPGYTRSLEHASHFAWPVFGAFITAAGQIPVDPADAKVTARGLLTAARMLAEGTSIVVLPEGERTLDGSVGRFYPGAFRLAIKAGVPVVPMAIHGGRTVSRRGDWRIRPGRMTAVFEPPIPTSGMTLADVERLSDQARNAIIAALQRETSHR